MGDSPDNPDGLPWEAASEEDEAPSAAELEDAGRHLQAKPWKSRPNRQLRHRGRPMLPKALRPIPRSLIVS